MEPDWAIVYRSSNRQACSDRALVLHSIGVPYEILTSDGSDYALVVPQAAEERAKFEIWEYEQENQPVPPPPDFRPNYEKAIPGATVYLLVVVVIGWMSAQSSFGLDWISAGRVDGELIRLGDWWRPITALTLHGGIKHMLGNIVFGLLFGILAGGLVGPGLAWLCIVVAGASGNVLNVYLLDEAHRSIGASTAVFAALGMISGFVWRAKLMAQERWAWRLGPIVGGIALLAYTGTGGPNTDVGAHVAGFACGFAAGLVLTWLPDLRTQGRTQLISGISAVLIILTGWFIAHLAWL